MIWEVLSSGRDLARLNEIARVLIRHGFGDLVRRLGMAGVLERAGEKLHWDCVSELVQLDPPQRVRRMMEELGTTFVKLGQILSTRVDLFPPEWIAEFEKLQDQAAPVPFDEIRAQIAEDLGADPETLFDNFDPQALAAGSIAQVHAAQLHDGTPVILKVRRPGIQPVVEADLRLLARLAEVAEQESPGLARFRPRAMIQHFALSLRRELDLDSECRNAERIEALFADNPDIVIPRVYWEWTSARMNVQARITGIAGRGLAALDGEGMDRGLLARRGAQAVFRMVLEAGFFHADPHPGNVFYLPGNRLAMIDFGMVGRLTPARRDQVVELLFGLARRDADAVAELLMAWAGDSNVNMDALAQDVGSFVDQFHGIPLQQIRVGRLLAELTAIMREHHIALPPDLALLFKAVLSLEGLGRMLDPQFDIIAEATPFLQATVARQYSTDRLKAQGMKGIQEALKLLAALPDGLRHVRRLMRSGGPAVRVDLPTLDRASERMEQSIARLTIGMVTSALIVGSSIVLAAAGNTGWFGPSLLGAMGFIASVAGAVWVIWSIRSGRKRS